MPPSYSPETRQDRITKQWVAFAPSRSSRPKRTSKPNDDTISKSEQPVEGCPFCPGHEEMLPTVFWELNDSTSMPWRTRVVPNKYPAFEMDRPPPEETCGLYRSRSSRGHQEVIIESPDHQQPLALMARAQVNAVLRTYLERYRTVRTKNADLVPFLFRNHGTRAGASIAHPHSQLIATDLPPPRIELEEREARARFEETGECPYCRMIAEEVEAEDRLVYGGDTFVVFVPFAARVPYEMWILPRTHEPEFGRLSPSDRKRLAPILSFALGQLRDCLDDPDYNLFVRTALEYESEAPHLHWSLRIRPRTTARAGFELSTGLRINPSIPERDAAVLRNGDEKNAPA